uniref:GLOBIN domain-containing protein n=2 Tax=Meloidogyne incognita TaxID=6306 RepID=A0A914LJ58_MELIC
MFLIAKIVRGRRLLHQLEQQEEKAKAAAKQHEQREKLSRGVSGVESIAVATTTLNCPVRTGTLKQNLKIKTNNTEVDDDLAVIELVEFSPKSINEGGGGNGDVDIREKTSPTSAFILDNQLQQQHIDRIQKPKKCAVRQRTDASLPSDEIERNEPSPAGYGSKAAAMRRTSSMPSIVESEQHLLMLAHQRQQRQHQLFHHSSGNCCLRRGFRASTIRHYNYEDRFTKLHKRALRFTWQRLLTRNGGKRIETVFEEVFERMMHKIPIMREMFNTRTFISAMSRCEIASPRDHARLIVKMFEAAIKNLDVEQNKRTDTDSGFDPKLLGQAHGYLRPYGFTSALWEAFGEAVIDIVVNQEAVRDLPGASQAWVVLTACLVDQLRAGFDSSSRECPFKHQQSKQRDTQLLLNGGYVAETVDIESSSNEEEETEQSSNRNLHQRHNDPKEQQQENDQKRSQEQLKILIEAANHETNLNNNLLFLTKNSSNNTRRRTITNLCDDDNSSFLFIDGKEQLEGQQKQNLLEKRRYSTMPQNNYEDEEDNNEQKQQQINKKINLKFIQNVASTEI